MAEIIARRGVTKPQKTSMRTAVHKVTITKQRLRQEKRKAKPINTRIAQIRALLRSLWWVLTMGKKGERKKIKIEKRALELDHQLNEESREGGWFLPSLALVWGMSAKTGSHTRCT